MNYLIVIFKNKKRKKIIKSFVRKNIAENFYNQKIEDSNKVKFNVEVENSEPCKYEIALITTTIDFQMDLFIQDDIGRNVKIKTDDSNYKILKISNYNLPEKLFDWSSNSRISFDFFYGKYFKSRELKNVFTVNNKLLIQQEDNVSIFSLKNSSESKRLLNILQEHMISENRSDAIFVPDNDNIQRKYLYTILEEKGINKSKLYRQSTTFSKRK
jgi:hypothetical protein